MESLITHCRPSQSKLGPILQTRGPYFEPRAGVTFGDVYDMGVSNKSRAHYRPLNSRALSRRTPTRRPPIDKNSRLLEPRPHLGASGVESPRATGCWWGLKSPKWGAPCNP